MTILPIILDSRPSYLRGAPGASLLSMPLGEGTLLSELAAALEVGQTKELRILPTFATDDSYEQRLLDCGVPGTRVVGRTVLASLASEFEPSDMVLIVDPRHWPLGGIDLESLLEHRDGSRWALHAVAVESSGQGAKEFVHLDEGGRVCSVRRYYEQVTFARIGSIPYSIVPLSLAGGVFFDSLGGLRVDLAARGMLSRDVQLRTWVLDLAEEEGLLALNETVLGRKAKALENKAVSKPALAGEERSASIGTLVPGGNVWLGADCRVDPSARIVGPVIIQRGAVIDADARLIGPAVIGASCHVGKGAMVAQSVLAGGMTLEPDSAIRHRVVCGPMDSTNACHGRSRDARPVLGRNEIRSLSPSAPPPHKRPKTIGTISDEGPLMQEDDQTWSFYPSMKRATDVIAAIIGLVLTAPILAVAAVLIKLESAGPIFFGHAREGQDGKVFRCLKFRTMGQDADRLQNELRKANTVDGPQFKLDNDPRVTRIGRLLRTTNVDELPQLFNVLVGQMSLVGPRPSPFRENQICVPWRRARLSVRPGITGLWQICRHDRTEGDFHQWIAYDIMYVRHISLWLDLKILAATLLTLGGKWSDPVSWLIRQPHEPAAAGA